MMIHYIGGAARCGKGILVRRLLAELHLPYLSLDVLKMGLARGYPEMAFDPDAGGMQVAERMWPLVREMSRNLFDEQAGYVFEGEILPRHVDALRQEYTTQVNACFLGYSTISPEQKLREIRTHSGYPNDWPQEYSDASLLSIIQREIAFSQYLQAECARVQFPYFDLSRQFMPVLDEVVAFIRSTNPT
jgi:putative acetyltransferase